MRVLHRIKAFLMRKFWTHCPRCHKAFGGHEKHHTQHAVAGVHYRIVCGKCVEKA